MPAFRSSSASSAPRPKTSGSPPFSRTTTLPCFAASTSCFWMNGQRYGWPPGTSATQTRSAVGGAKSSNRGGTSLSYSTRSARARHSTARRVNKPGSPGPAPTRKTRGTHDSDMTVRSNLNQLIGLRHVHVGTGPLGQLAQVNAKIKQPDHRGEHGAPSNQVRGRRDDRGEHGNGKDPDLQAHLQPARGHA